jgi:hypothetical protein
MNATILLYPLAVLLFLIHLRINICLLFLIIRWAQTWKEVGWLSGHDNLGRPSPAPHFYSAFYTRQ